MNCSNSQRSVTESGGWTYYSGQCYVNSGRFLNETPIPGVKTKSVRLKSRRNQANSDPIGLPYPAVRVQIILTRLGWWWSRRWFTQEQVQQMHPGWADPWNFPKCGNFDCILLEVEDCVRALLGFYVVSDRCEILLCFCLYTPFLTLLHLCKLLWT